MNDRSARRVSDRLRAVDWADDAGAFRHAPSRALLMREYLRRAALWAQAYGAGDAWPFLDLAALVHPGVTVPADVAAELEPFLRGLAPASLRTTCRAAVRWAALHEARPDLAAGPAPGLPDPYEPLLLMYERGGGYHLEEYLDLNGVMIPLRDVRSNAAATAFTTLAPATLDALDGEGEAAYFAKTDERHPRHRPRGIVRRRVEDDGGTHDEAFTRNLRWEPTDYLRRYALGHNDVDHVRITEIEAAAFIESLTGGPAAR